MTNSPWLEPIEKRTGDRLLFDSTCDYCVANKGKRSPPHDASARCESGSYKHCSCEVCF
jgi:hypothetical protein